MTFGLRIRVDFNRRTGDGSVTGSLRRATGTIHIGDVVIATQPGEDIEHFARVTSIDNETGRVTLAVNWDSNPDGWMPVAGTAYTEAPGGLVVPGAVLYRVSPVASGASFASGRATSAQPVSA